MIKMRKSNLQGVYGPIWTYGMEECAMGLTKKPKVPYCLPSARGMLKKDVDKNRIQWAWFEVKPNKPK